MGTRATLKHGISIEPFIWGEINFQFGFLFNVNNVKLWNMMKGFKIELLQKSQEFFTLIAKIMTMLSITKTLTLSLSRAHHICIMFNHIFVPPFGTHYLMDHNCVGMYFNLYFHLKFEMGGDGKDTIQTPSKYLGI